MAKAKVAIVDSSALISLANVEDALHAQAVQLDEILTADGWLVLLPTEVFAETLNAIGKKMSRQDSVLVGRAIVERYDARDIDFIHAEPHLYDLALKLQGWGKGGPSFVDCLVMALADEYGTKHIFGFDATFKKNGYKPPERERSRLQEA